MLKFPQGYVLLDCGEGTFGQLFRKFGLNVYGDFIRNWNVLFVSHMHADHHIGAINVFIERKKVCLTG